MEVTPGIANLGLPRYVPWIIKGTSLGVWYDTLEIRYKILCPQCHCLVTYETIKTVYREVVLSERKCCQGCRARISFEKNPRFVGLFLDFWCRTNHLPESASWLLRFPRRSSIFGQGKSTPPLGECLFSRGKDESSVRVKNRISQWRSSRWKL